MKPNVRLQTNVLCIRQGDGPRLSQDEIVSRLGYFELMEYRRLNPILWVGAPGYQWTVRQKWELEGPRGRSNGTLGSLWRKRPDLNPVPSGQCRNPFEELAPEPDVAEEPRPTQESASPIESPVSGPEEIVHEQDEVITAGIDDDLLVVAPPGTGKTHTLVERIAYLVAQRLVENPREQILVLSFTRSAVAELKKRLIAKVRAGGPDDLLYVQIRTFDSLATNLLRQDLSLDGIASGYDKRIAQFNDLLARGGLPAAREALSKVRFLLVDEVQDLNGDRARMVLAIAGEVAKNDGCSMFLGDPAQAIYDYEENESDNALTSVDFLRQLGRGDYRGCRPPTKREYSEYRRFETEAMLAFVRSARSAMGSDGLYPDGSHLDELLGSLGARVLLGNVPTTIDQSATTAILTRNNLEAYWIWSWLRERGVTADLWRGARGSYWPGWIARLFLGFQGDSISIEKAHQRWEKFVAQHVGITFEQAICYLRSQGLTDGSSDIIPIATIADQLLNSAPVPGEEGPASRLVISTIHRSKGLEFDDVLLLAPSRMNSDEDVRVVYVAATRAKRSLRVLKRDEKVIRHGARRDRITTSGFHVFSYPEAPRIGLLVDGYDVIDADSILALDQPLESQKYLWDECAGRSRTMTVSGTSAAISGREIGALSRSVSEDVRTLRRIRGNSDSMLDGLLVADLATVSFPDFGSSAQQALGAARMAIIPVVTGITSV